MKTGFESGKVYGKDNVEVMVFDIRDGMMYAVAFDSDGKVLSMDCYDEEHDMMVVGDIVITPRDCSPYLTLRFGDDMAMIAVERMKDYASKLKEEALKVELFAEAVAQIDHNRRD